MPEFHSTCLIRFVGDFTLLGQVHLDKPQVGVLVAVLKCVPCTKCSTTHHPCIPPCLCSKDVSTHRGLERKIVLVEGTSQLEEALLEFLLMSFTFPHQLATNLLSLESLSRSMIVPALQKGVFTRECCRHGFPRRSVRGLE